ncbi:MAG: helicase-associated domain-containing protein [Treponema sp.]|jgi:DNA excision repair protein ERCC-3|nr:helicase-associated domain-containing protein [Treponema sp.]
MDPAKPLIVQSDRTLLLDVHSPQAEDARSAVLPFAELEKSPEHIHTYRITPLSLWNAASAGFRPRDITGVLERYSRYPVPAGIADGFADTMARYGKIRMTGAADPVAGGAGEGPPEELRLLIEDEAIIAEIRAARSLEKILGPEEGGFRLKVTDRGTVKRELIRMGWPVKDEASFAKGEALDIRLRKQSASGLPFTLRDYQLEAARAVAGGGGPGTGYGVVVLPCGSGKTIVGMILMEFLKTNTLILTTNVAAVHQWIEELLDKTELRPEEIAEYSGDTKTVAPVTIATYQIITWRPDRASDFPHFRLFRQRPWGLIIYDEVHLLPAPVFRVTAELQAVRRLGLTATLIREDGAEDAVFSLVGPKRYDVPWKDLEVKGWIACALCREIRLNLPEQLKIPYAVAPPREKYRLASENPLKEQIVLQLIENHPEDQILVIGQYISQLESLARLLRAPLITGKKANAEREQIYDAFRKGRVRVIVVSKVANFAIDLPDASMAVQVSGSFGSRQEEAQRLGRILRPKGRNSLFYTLVSRYTVEEDFAANRQKFLAEQGYKYSIQHWEEAE